MKSILQEASSVERAVDKAWNEAGKPKEFTIKILDQGERNFFGLMRRPAVVSILYKPEKSTYQQPRSRQRTGSVHNGTERAPRGRQASSASTSASRSSTGRRQESSDRYRSNSRDRSISRSDDMNSWRDDWKKNVTDNVAHLLKLMNVKTGFQAEAGADKVLTVTFKQAIIHDEEEQRMLFASLSYLSIQFLKREYKNRFTGFRIVVTGPVGAKRAEKTEEPAKVERSAAPAASSAKAPAARSSRSSSSRTSNASTSSSRQRTGTTGRPRKTSGAANDEHLTEQLKFAQQQLEQEEEVKQVFETAIRQTTGENEAPASVAPAPEQKEAVPVAAPVEKKAKPAKPVKKEVKAQPEKKAASASSQKEQKYQPFFVMPDKNESSDDS